MIENVEQNNDKPYWKQFYSSLGLWISLYLIIIVLGFYMIKVDFAFATHQQIKPPTENLSKSLTNPTNESSKMIKNNNND